MSITTASPIYDLGTRADYLEFGIGEKRRSHKKAGTDRLAPGFYCDAASIDEFIALGNRLADQHGRKVRAQGYVMSYHPDELSVRKRDDLQRGGDLGFLLAKRMHPNSPCLIVVHDDGKGGAVHAHVTVLNHDSATGQSLRDFRAHWQVKKANDALMAEEGMHVLAPVIKAREHGWAVRRSELAVFEQQLGDAVAAALVDPSSIDIASFRAACSARGVEVVIDEHEVRTNHRRGKVQGDTAVGITYKMTDASTPGKTPRLRRRKASAISADFTHDAIIAALGAKLPLQLATVHAPAHRPALAVSEATENVAAYPGVLVAGGVAFAGSRRGRRTEILQLLDGVLAAGMFGNLPGFVRQCVKAGIRVLQHRRDLAYAIQGSHQRWTAADLGEPYTAAAVAELAAEIAELRNMAPPESRHLPVPQLVALFDSGSLDEESPPPRLRKRRKNAPNLTPARERHLSRQYGDRTYGGGL